MSKSQIPHSKIVGVSTVVPEQQVDNMDLHADFPAAELRKIVQMAGIRKRHISDGTICSSDLCLAAADNLLKKLNWLADSIDALIFVTQSPDYFLPSTASLLHRDLGLSHHCAAFDVGLGCSGYPYGLWLGSMMLNFGHKRVLVLHGETPSLFTDPLDRGTHLLFGDAGSATALEYYENATPCYFNLQSDGKGFDQLIIPAGGFRKPISDQERDYQLYMNGTGLFNFTLERVPPLIMDTLNQAALNTEQVDYYVFHQSNQFMMKHIAKKCNLAETSTPIILENFGNTGGVSVPLAITQALTAEKRAANCKLMLLGYGVGLSWASALVDLSADAVLIHDMINQPRIAGNLREAQ
jgi:3-oxoacyl-[acyl-carrier-protein] synthase III